MMTHLDFDPDYDSEGLTRRVRRQLTEQEKAWINAILQSNPQWTDVTIGDLWVDGECTCGCRTVHLELPSQPQNPKTQHLGVENVGMIWVSTELGKVIGITLLAKRGNLCELEVVYQEGTEPFPATWREVSRKILV